MSETTATTESIYCACGAQWHGRYTRSAVISDHKERWATGKCGCRYVIHATFAKHFKCKCDECVVSRKR
jgi:ribosomal protein S27AE